MHISLLLDPVLFFVAAPILLYGVCLVIAFVSLFPRLQLQHGKSEEMVDVELKASLQWYAALDTAPVPKWNRRSEKNEPVLRPMTRALGRGDSFK